ncbi:uncharacterized protein LOC114163590 [Vigna unguiculata]|uniref:uncharacterized protein LOC114163590 n=1 Tax=Vigna unguiculata TaxID=3917 RepID=UPI00101608A8|nr:uncharacterized protein LOC114163590 [Vigna unguiculata]
MPQATCRVYCMTGVEAAGSSNLVMGRCMIVGKSLCVLYDFGATHSFVSIACVERLGLPVRELQCELVVSTTTYGLVRMSSLCAKCPVEVEGRRYKVNLICLPLQELEEKEGTSVIPVVHKFVDVFPDEVSGLPPNRKVEFSIDLVPGTGPISMTPYHMAPAELVELKKQIEELLGK